MILGVDSAVTIPAIGAPGSVAKVYENAEKLFQLADLPIGVAIYGLGALGTRGSAANLREFEVRDPDRFSKYNSGGCPARLDRKFLLEV